MHLDITLYELYTPGKGASVSVHGYHRLTKSASEVIKMSSELQDEIEALGFTYPDILTVEGSVEESTLCIRAEIKPQLDKHEQAFVDCTLKIKVPSSYPEQAALPSLVDVRGLQDSLETSLNDLLRSEADSLQGSVGALGHLIHTAQECLTEHNRPEGNCAFCLETLLQQAEEINLKRVVRLPCYHTFHTPCYASWWLWQQRNAAQQEAELVAHTGSQAARAWISEKLPPKETPPYQHLYSTSCPVCRSPSPLDDLSQLASHLDKLLASGQEVPSISRSHTSATEGLADGTIEGTLKNGQIGDTVCKLSIAKVQERHQKLFAKQQAAGGIIDLDATSYSIFRPPQPPNSEPPAPEAAVSSTGATAEATGVTGISARQSDKPCQAQARRPEPTHRQPYTNARQRHRAHDIDSIETDVASKAAGARGRGAGRHSRGRQNQVTRVQHTTCSQVGRLRDTHQTGTAPAQTFLNSADSS